MDIDSKLNEIRAFARARYIPVILEEGADELVAAIQKYNPAKILEIGTSIGTSGILMLANSAARLITIDINEEAVDLAKENFSSLGLSDRVQFLLGDCQEIIKYLTTKFDFIFLDGPKGQYMEMLDTLISLLNDGGVLFADNILFHNEVEKDGSIKHKHRTIVKNLRTFISTVEQREDLTCQILRKGDGILICQKLC